MGSEESTGEEVGLCAEITTLIWMCGVTKMDRARSERIRGTTKVGGISKQVQEMRLKWYGHVMRRDEEYVGERMMKMDVDVMTRKGRPKRRWMYSVNMDVREKGLSGEKTQNRTVWRQRVRYIDSS